MLKYLFVSVLVVTALTCCRKDCSPPLKNNTMPVAVVKVNQKLTEISKTIGSTASIVFINGYGTDMSTWQNLYTALSSNATVFAYNRAGIGASENIPGARDASTIAIEMRAILEANHIKPPYVLVAHSMGGIYARMFYHLNPGKVKGIVLVDATHENQLDSLLSMLPQQSRDLAMAEIRAANDSALSLMPAGSLKEEFRSNFATNYEQIRQYPAIINLPLYVITSTKITSGTPPIVTDVHRALHEQWSKNAGANGKFITTSNSGHFIQVKEPGLVAEGIRWILEK